MFESRNQKKIIGSGIVISALEWQEYSLFGYFASIISQNFFPENEQYINIIYSFAVFFVGFLFRPLGGFFFGILGEKKGYKQSIIYSILLMGLSTTMIGLIPSYENIGMASPILLILFRILQGIAVGGNYGGIFVFMTENSPKNRVGFFGSLGSFGVISGLLLGSAISTLITTFSEPDFLTSYGWRIPYLISFINVFVAYFMHTQIQDISSPDEPKIGIHKNIKENFSKIITAIGVILLDSIGIYTMYIFFINYIHIYYDIALEKALLINTINTLILVALIPVFGYISDYVNKKKMVITTAFLYIVISPITFLLIQKTDHLYIFIAQFIFTIPMAMCYATLPSFIPSAFNKKIRYASSSIAFNVSVSIFGGLTPLGLSFLINLTNDLTIPIYALMLVGVISAFAAHKLKSD